MVSECELSSSSSSESSFWTATVGAGRKRKAYTGRSRTTRWRRKKSGAPLSEPSDEQSSTSDAEEGYGISDENAALSESRICSINSSDSKVLHSSDPADDSSSSASGSEYCPSEDGSQSDASPGFSSDLECFEAHYLDEDPEGAEPVVQQIDHGGEEENGPPVPDDDDDPDNPDEPDAVQSSSSSSDESDSDNENDREVVNLHNISLNVNIRLLRNLTKGQLISLVLCNAVRHKMTFESLIDQFKTLNMFCGPHFFPESKTKLWDVIALNRTGIQYHVYCGRQDCGRYLGKKTRFNEFAVCRCGYRIPIGKAKSFITLDLKTQLKYFLSIPGIWNKLQYPQTRQKTSATAIEDVMDGTRYRTLKEEGGVLSNPHNFSYFFSLDACKPYKKGSLKIVPFYVRINELPPELRQKFHFLAGVFCDHYEPNYQAFILPIVKQLRKLAVTGINWKPDGINEVISRFYCLGFNVDSPVRYAILNMSKWDSIQYGCTYCTHQGIRVARSQRYPEVNLEGIPPFEDRSHNGMLAAMTRFEEEPGLDFHQGHKGASVLMLLDHLDLRDGQAHDDLHQDHEGCTADLTELLLTLAEARINENLPAIRLIREIDARMLRIKTPSRISRKPRSISKRSSYSGTEWRNWLIFYAIPCLFGLIKPEYLDILASLSYSCYLLSKDVMEPEEINTAERLLLRAGHSFERKFGVGRLKYNLHLTTKHKVRSVRNLGNPCMYSTYNFESLHRKMTGKVTSPKGVLEQVISRVMLHITAYASQYDERLPEDVRLRIEETLHPYQVQGIREVAPHVYLVGRVCARAVTQEEAVVFQREGIPVRDIVEYKSCLIRSNRYRSLARQNQDIKTDDTFLYTWQNTFCTIRTIFSFMAGNGEERSGMFVTEPGMIQAMPVARHISILENADGEIMQFRTLEQIRNPAIKINIGDIFYAVSVPNCYEID